MIKLFGDINANIIYYELDETSANLTDTILIVALFCGRREY
jgi:hypothetical protein